MNKKEKLLVVVDMINGFVKEGALADPKIARIIPENIRVIKEVLKDNGLVAFANDAHDQDSREFERYPVHCVKGTKEAEVVSELSPYLKDALIIAKNSTSTLMVNDFITEISALKALREVVITGCCTDICVMNLAIPLNNYFDQMNLPVDVIVPVDAVETYDAPWHNRDEYQADALKFMEQAGVKLVRTYGGEPYARK